MLTVRASLCALLVLAVATAVARAGESLEVAASTSGEHCTAIIAGHKATVDGSTYATHTNDCGNCDFRISFVHSRDFPEGAQRPVFEVRLEYPKYVGYHRGRAFWPEHTEKTYPWNITAPIGFIPQVPHTFAYLDGTYGLVNEHQVAMGESTCSAKLTAKPVSQGGDALLEMASLSRIALERCTTALCAVELMGALGEHYGYYGSSYTGDPNEDKMESGEAMVIGDGQEAWVFHILPDDTGKSAIWAAQRVPEGHVAAVANEFIIGNVDSQDTKNFRHSRNMVPVAIRQGFYNPKTDGPFNFIKAFTYGHPHARYSQRRQWRVLSLAAPSLQIPGDTPIVELPFSVPVDKPLSVRDVYAMHRDTYGGTPYDLSEGMAAGPYDNPNRWDMGVGSGATLEELAPGSFERPISMFRAGYSYVAQSRSWLPDEIGAMMWFGPYAPHNSVFMPLYVAGGDVPESLETGSLHSYNPDSAYWHFCVVGNWCDRFYKFIVHDVLQHQSSLESTFLQHQQAVEEKAHKLLVTDEHYAKKEQKHAQRAQQHHGSLVGHQSAAAPPFHQITQQKRSQAHRYLHEYSKECTQRVLSVWTALWHDLISKYHDGYMYAQRVVERLNPTKLFYPLWWLKQVGYFDNPDAANSLGQPAPVPAASQKNTNVVSLPATAAVHQGASSGWLFYLCMLCLLVAAFAAGFGCAGRLNAERSASSYDSMAYDTVY